MPHQDGAEWFTNVEVKTQDGRTLRFYDDLMKGKILLVNFFFTECDGICPRMTQNLVGVQKLLAPRVGKDIFMYSIRLEPEHDTPEKTGTAYAGRTVPGPVGPSSPAARGYRVASSALGFVNSDPVQGQRSGGSISAPCGSPTSRCIAGR